MELLYVVTSLDSLCTFKYNTACNLKDLNASR